MRGRLETVLSLVLTVAAVAVAGAVVWRQFLSNSPMASGIDLLGSGAEPGEPQFYPDWRNWLADGTAMDRDSASVVIIQFSDLECPACRRFHDRVVKGTKDSFRAAVTFAFIHLPLRTHRFSEISAVAAECAANQERFPEFVEALLIKQDSIGLKPWASYALDAEVPRPDEFLTCVENQESLPRVKAGRALADSIGITGTPTVFVNGWRLPAPPKSDELSRIIRRILEGMEPFPNQR